MSTTLTANFETRREAEMTIERLVQEQKIERTDIFVSAAGDENTAGEDRDGSGVEAGTPSPTTKGEAALNGKIRVSVDLQDDAKAALVRAAFAEFDAKDLSAG